VTPPTSPARSRARPAALVTEIGRHVADAVRPVSLPAADAVAQVTEAAGDALAAAPPSRL
jgi:hypothetical protein